MNEKIGIFTYSLPHRKTYDTLSLLKAKGYTNVTVFGEKHHYEKKFKPLIEHRPGVVHQIHPEQLCKNLGYEYKEGFERSFLPANAKILICGSRIIEQDIIDDYRIINAHPAYLPNIRGLDALKWAIYEGEPIGVTSYRLGEKTDSGYFIDRNTVPVYYNDTFHAVAQRQYEMEVSMLVEAIEKIEMSSGDLLSDEYPLRKRMPHTMETRLFERFEKLVSGVKID